MNYKEFYFWLEGYLLAKEGALLSSDLETIREKMKAVRPGRELPVPVLYPSVFPTNPPGGYDIICDSRPNSI